MPPTTTPAHTHDGQTDGDTADPADVNEVRLTGQVSAAPERHTLPSGDEVVHLRVVVRRPSEGVDTLPVQVGPAPPTGRRPAAGQVGRRQLALATALAPGDRVEVTGRLRRRWWEAGGGRRSRIEVAASTVHPITSGRR